MRSIIGAAVFALAVAAAPPTLEDVVLLEDFEDDAPGGLPGGWKWRAFGSDEKIPYRVAADEDGNRFLRAEDRGENVMLYKEVRWDAVARPYLSWRWRIRAVPAGADARREETADNAAGVYLTYSRRLGLVPRTVKFVWSGALSRGAAFRRPGVGMPWTVVAGNGPADASAWRRVAVRIDAVYERTFGGRAPHRPLGIGVLTDANSTGSYAAADYDDFAVSRAPPEGAELVAVTEILELEN